MDNKIGIQELAAAIAKVREIDGSEAEIFCRSVFEVVSEFLVMLPVQPLILPTFLMSG